MNPRPWWKIVDWRIVLAVAVPVWALLGGAIYFLSGKPEKPQIVNGPPTPPVSPIPIPTQPVEILPAPRGIREVVIAPRLFVTEVAAAPREVKLDPALVPTLVALADELVRNFRVANMAKVTANTVVAEKAEPKGTPENCKTYGTAIHFVKSPVEAFKLAPKQDKLVFIIHLAGNIEDDGFT